MSCELANLEKFPEIYFMSLRILKNYIDDKIYI